MIEELPDDKDRLLAVRTFDKNIVVTAGAGTGKTTLLVDRITHLLMRETDPLSITDIIAITSMPRLYLCIKSRSKAAS